MHTRAAHIVGEKRRAGNLRLLGECVSTAAARLETALVRIIHSHRGGDARQEVRVLKRKLPKPGLFGAAPAICLSRLLIPTCSSPNI